MRAIVFCAAVLFAATAQAGPMDFGPLCCGGESNWHYDSTEPHAQYNTVTGNVSLHNIPATADAMYLFIPTIAMAVDVRDVPGVTKYSRTVRPVTISSLHEKPWWESPFGFPETMDLGPIMLPNQTIFEWSYFGTMPGQRGIDAWVMVAVPELASFWLAVVAFLAVVTASRIWRMS